MASTNQSPEYQKAEQNYLNTQTDDDRIYWLEEMIKECPKHKSAEKMLAQLKTRLKKLKEKINKSKKSGKSKKGIKKEEMQAVFVGFTNTGKSSLLAKLTNATPKTSQNEFTTQEPEIGMLEYKGTKMQLIDQPSLGNENFDIGITNTADTLLLTIKSIQEIPEIEKHLKKARGKRIIILTKSDTLNETQKRKLSETLKSKKYNFLLTSIYTDEGIEELKEKLFQSFGMIRVYLKEPGKPASDKPMTIEPNSTVLDIAKKISNSFAKTIKQTKITGPSAKFPNQKVSLNHKVKDLDTIEFKTY